MQEYPGQRRGSRRYHYDGHDYHRDNLALITVRQFRCCIKKCPGRARYPVEDPERVKATLHNHARNPSEFRTWEFRKALVERAKRDLAIPIASIFRKLSREYLDVSEEVTPSYERRRMRRARRKVMPNIPHSYSALGELLLSDEQVKNTFGMSDPLPGQTEKEIFFQKKIEGPNGTTLVFASPSLLQNCLGKATRIKIDATFKVLPRVPAARQMFSIHACHGVNTFPVIFCIMELKTKQAYKQLFEYLRDELLPGWDLQECMCDFEKGLRQALHEVFPNCTVLGCYFHYTQKKWSKLGLMRMPARLKIEARDFKANIMALAFGRKEDIPRVFEQIEENVTLALKVKVDPFLDYYRNTWLSTNGNNFTPEDFSVYGIPDRTNNHIESFHSRLHEVRPNIWFFLNLLIGLNIESRQNFGRFNNGLLVTPTIPERILWTEARIVNARQLLEAGRLQPLEFVRWCRTSVKDTLAVVRQGRRLRRHLKAENLQLNYDEVETSSSGSDVSSVDFEFEPNPHAQEVMEREDVEAELELARENQQIQIVLPDDDDSVWELSEDEDIQLIHASQLFEDQDSTPIVKPPEVPSVPVTRPEGACIICIQARATYLALPCTHTLVCDDCHGLFVARTCFRCERDITNLIRFIST